ncbi:MAG: hypothetical protein WC313_01360 [Candidatus Kapaibacterium sp.]
MRHINFYPLYIHGEGWGEVLDFYPKHIENMHLITFRRFQSFGRFGK